MAKHWLNTDQHEDQQDNEFVFEVPAKNPQKEANLISRLFFWYEYIMQVNMYTRMYIKL